MENIYKFVYTARVVPTTATTMGNICVCIDHFSSLLLMYTVHVRLWNDQEFCSDTSLMISGFLLLLLFFSSYFERQFGVTLVNLPEKRQNKLMMTKRLFSALLCSLPLSPSPPLPTNSSCSALFNYREHSNDERIRTQSKSKFWWLSS